MPSAFLGGPFDAVYIASLALTVFVLHALGCFWDTRFWRSLLFISGPEGFHSACFRFLFGAATGAVYRLSLPLKGSTLHAFVFFCCGPPFGAIHQVFLHRRAILVLEQLLDCTLSNIRNNEVLRESIACCRGICLSCSFPGMVLLQRLRSHHIVESPHMLPI